jgi:7-dehydrocholesterol reductase
MKATKTTAAAAAAGGKSTRKDDWSVGTGLIPGRELLGPLLLMITTPCFSIVYFHVCTQLDGDFVAFFRMLLGMQQPEQGLSSSSMGMLLLWRIWPDPWNTHVWKMILSFFAFQLILMRIVPGRRMTSTLTPNGNLPVYTANGTACYAITIVTLLVSAHLGVFDPASIYDMYGNILASLNVFAWLFCAALYVKGHVAPSTTDSGTTGHVLQDFFWGMELYPEFFGWDVKVFTNCRSGMMFWAVAVTSFAYKNMQQQQDGQLQYGMAVSVALQLIYISKFFHWEMGYMRSMDIQHDRAGYYI